jgi:hypothetical protein
MPTTADGRRILDPGDRTRKGVFADEPANSALEFNFDKTVQAMGAYVPKSKAAEPANSTVDYAEVKKSTVPVPFGELVRILDAVMARIDNGDGALHKIIVEQRVRNDKATQQISALNARVAALERKTKD